MDPVDRRTSCSVYPPAEAAAAPPPGGTVERWCHELVVRADLAVALEPAPLPDVWEEAPPVRRIARPGRAPELVLAGRSPRTPRSLASAGARARLVHTLLHHELQAAELFAWAVLAFPEAPAAFRAGLVGLAREELLHLGLYARHLRRLGARPGDWPVHDWFWERVGAVDGPLAFVALLGLGLEGANLEHSARFAERFRAAGDVEGARVLERVERDEVRHVAFAVRWFEELSGAPLEYDAWRRELPPPLTPAILRGRPLNARARRAAGQDERFLARLAAEPDAGGPR